MDVQDDVYCVEWTEDKLLEISSSHDGIKSEKCFNAIVMASNEKLEKPFIRVTLRVKEILGENSPKPALPKG